MCRRTCWCLYLCSSMSKRFEHGRQPLALDPPVRSQQPVPSDFPSFSTYSNLILQCNSTVYYITVSPCSFLMRFISSISLSVYIPRLPLCRWIPFFSSICWFRLFYCVTSPISVYNWSHLGQRVNSLHTVEINAVYRNPRFWSNLLEIYQGWGSRRRNYLLQLILQPGSGLFWN